MIPVDHTVRIRFCYNIFGCFKIVLDLYNILLELRLKILIKTLFMINI